MNHALCFVIPLEPVAKERPRFGKGFVYTATKTKTFEKAVGIWVKQIYRNKPLDCPLRLTAKFIVKKPKNPKFPDHPAVRYDLDNFFKSLKDALNGILWVDDSRICEYGAGSGKYFDLTGLGPRIEIKVEVLTS